MKIKTALGDMNITDKFEATLKYGKAFNVGDRVWVEYGDFRYPSIIVERTAEWHMYKIKIYTQRHSLWSKFLLGLCGATDYILDEIDVEDVYTTRYGKE